MKKKPRQKAISTITQPKPIGKIVLIGIVATALFFGIEYWSANRMSESYAPFAHNPNCWFLNYSRGGLPFIVSDQLKENCFGVTPIDFNYHDPNLIPDLIRINQ